MNERRESSWGQLVHGDPKTPLVRELPRRQHDDGYGRCGCCGGSLKYGEPGLCSGCVYHGCTVETQACYHDLRSQRRGTTAPFKRSKKGTPIMALGLSDEEAAKLYRPEA